MIQNNYYITVLSLGIIDKGNNSTHHRMTLRYLLDEWCAAVARHLNRAQEWRTKPVQKEMSINTCTTWM